ncbi:MAG: type I restriction endonuclease [Sulfuricurvum sp.]|nr:type I restriction endonuclease [Sulfuricurvum sp.]
MSKHKEITFETEIVEYLTHHQWIEGTSDGYNKALALYPEDLIAYIRNTQPSEYEKFSKRHQSNTDIALCRHVASMMDKQGSLYYLRHELKEINARFKLCQFKPDLYSEKLQADYDANILRVVRQVYYSEHNRNSIDLVLFLNGIPVATIELKTDFTQNVQDAINQYKYDRNPKDPATRHEEPLLAFKRRSLVHFAVSTDEVYMTTQLKGKETFFLPFNKGCEGGAAGNPPNPSGYATSYLWEEILAKDTWLKIIGRYIHLEVKDKEDFTGRRYKSESVIFPRYHQLDVVSKLTLDARRNGAGHRYLIQHSAGSGKSNSIAWLAHQLSSLHNDQAERIFNSVIVITDRTVLDAQLQETISQFEHKDGVVVRINRDEGEGSKSTQLTDALERGAAIIIVTIQTFPFVLDAIRERTTLKGRSYAIIADEAHSSQTGSTAKQLREVLTAEQIAEGEEISAEDVLAASIAARTQNDNISYFAFTATPKSKTLQMFGTLPDSSRPAASDNIPRPFHSYTMRQAIEEGFIIDVLKSYTTYDLAYRLSTAQGEKEVDAKKARIQLAKWVKLHPYNIAQKIQIIIEHFRTHIAHLLDGQAKAMVVTGSRKEAVRYKLAFDKYIKENNYTGVAAMVAFSGSVIDDAEGLNEEYTESSMNPGLKGRDMRKAFDTDDYQVMIVANKFQTGFDQPKLCAMYVDKKLSGVEAVQTLSRLNRTYPGKEVVFILDFFNKAEDIKEAFDPYYTTAELTDVSNPNDIFDLKIKLDANGIYIQNEVEQFALAYFDPKGTQEAMSAAVKPAADRYKTRYKAALEAINSTNTALSYAKANKDETGSHNAERDLSGAKEEKDALDLFKKDLGTFVRMYEFLSQIVDYEDPDLEKLCVFARGLLPNLKVIDIAPPIDIGSVEMTHYSLRNKKVQKIDLQSGTIDPDAPGGGVAKENKTDTLEHIIKKMNELFSGELTDDDKLNYARTIRDKVMENSKVVEQFRTNSKEQAMMGDFPSVMTDAIIESMDAHQSMAKQVFESETKREGFARLILDMIYRDMGSALP